MKLLFVMLTMRGGGAEGALVNLVNNLDKTKYDVTVLSLFNHGTNIEKLNEDVNYKYIFNRYIPGNKYIFKFLSPRLLFKFFIKESYDVIIAYLQGVTSRIVAGAPKKQIIVSRVGCTFLNNADSSSAYRSRKEMTKCYNRYNRIVANSKDALNSFFEVTGVENNLGVLYNVFDTKMILNKSSEKIDFIKDNKTINFITTGTLSNVKGYMRLLECLKKISDEGLSCHLYIIGAGDEENALKEYVNNNLKDKVTFLGFQKNPYKYVCQADMYICSSYDEGFSNAVAEAVILGIPVLTTDCCGMKEILGDNEEGGVIVENSSEGIYSGIKNILEHPDILVSYKEKIKSRQEFFKTETGIKQTEVFLNSLICSK